MITAIGHRGAPVCCHGHWRCPSRLCHAIVFAARPTLAVVNLCGGFRSNVFADIGEPTTQWGRFPRRSPRATSTQTLRRTKEPPCEA